MNIGQPVREIEVPVPNPEPQRIIVPERIPDEAPEKIVPDHKPEKVAA